MSRWVAAIAAFALIVLVSCGSHAKYSGWTPANPTTAYLPYVEDVKFPAEIYQNQPFEIEIAFSSQAKPEVLFGYTSLNPSEPYTIRKVGSFYSQWGLDNPAVPAENRPFIQLQPWLINLPMVGENAPVKTTRVMHYAKPGTYVLRIESAPTREQGGAISALYYDCDDSPGVTRPCETLYRNYLFTVLPPKAE
jgi:hypothetical protein